MLYMCKPIMYKLPNDLRKAIRTGNFKGTTSGHCPLNVQLNVVIIPAEYSDQFRKFCELNSQALPIIAELAPGENSFPASVAKDADIRTDLGSYRIFRDGIELGQQPNLNEIWRDDLVTFLLGCSFTFERALTQAGFSMRHQELECTVPMYETTIKCISSGVFHGNLVVSMRPFKKDQVDQVIAVSSQYPKMHGAPVHVGDAQMLGIEDLAKPEYSDHGVPVNDGEVPVFWACGVTGMNVVTKTKLPLAITHSPGKMFVSDLMAQQFKV